MKNQAVAPAVDTDQLTVEHWRERFKEALPRFKSLREVAELLAREDGDFGETDHLIPKSPDQRFRPKLITLIPFPTRV